MLNWSIFTTFINTKALTM